MDTIDATLKQESAEWPAPPHFALPKAVDSNAKDSCLVVLSDGRKLVGRLVHFFPEDEALEFIPSRASSHSRVAFNELKSLRLVAPLHLRKQAAALETQGEEVFPASERQPFTVDYGDGEKFTGETQGFVTRKEGLYLFILNDSGNVIRCFVPAQSMKDYQIGAPIGEMLIKEKIATKQEVEAGLKKQQELRTQRIGDYLTAHQIVTPEQLALAIKVQKSLPHMRLGEALIQEKLITQAQLDEALRKQQQDRKIALGEILVGMGVVDEDGIKRTMAKKLGIPVVGLRKFNIDLNVTQLAPKNIIEKYKVMPLCRSGNALIVAIENPMHWAPLEELRFSTKMAIEPVMASADDIAYAINRFYGGGGSGDFEWDRRDGDLEFNRTSTEDVKIEDIASQLRLENKEAVERTEQTVAESDNALVKLVNRMILDAHQQGASDIHIETYPDKQNTRIRFRKDGSLVRYLEIPSNFRSAIISRIKIMAHLDISERRKPQDGKIDFKQFGPAKIELRVATIPTANGIEDIVMRLLAGAKPIPIDNLGLRPETLAHLKKIAAKPYGLFLICGPTGSGKTTTLHSVLGHINTPERKIWTAEDPIEITQQGLRQVQVNAKIDWTFAAAMRSFLRADPDVIMVGEMRDQETTKTGIEASLTGHLVFSTLHTNSAPESVVRLLDLGMDPFNFSDALLGVLAQRLVKRHCDKCREAYIATDEEIQMLAEEYCAASSLDPVAIVKEWRAAYAADGGKFNLFKAVGCNECNASGYRGRLGLHELLVASAPIKKLIQGRATVAEVTAAAMTEGMRTLKQDGIDKVLQGHTDMQQIRAACS